MKFAVLGLVLSAVLAPNANAATVHGIEVETYGEGILALSFTLVKPSALATKVIDAMTKSSEMVPVKNSNGLLTGKDINFHSGTDNVVLLDLKLNLVPTPHYKIQAGPHGVAVDLEGPPAENLYNVLSKSTSKSVLSIANQNGTVVLEGDQLAILESDTFAGSYITCRSTRHKKLYCELSFRY